MTTVLAPLYDTRSERYPIYHSGILVFVITTCLPLNLGISRLPAVDVFMLLSVGFLSLFMLARNEHVGQSLLSHLSIVKQARYSKKHQVNKMTRFDGTALNAYKEYQHNPFSLLQNVVEQIIITHDEHMDLKTRIKLEEMHVSLQKKTRELCNHYS
ncbi:MAG: hypothetical protein ACREBI_04645 [Nitrosotalea sp.]